MPVAAKEKWEKVIDEMAESLAKHFESLPERERKRRLKALAGSRACPKEKPPRKPRRPSNNLI